MNDTLQRPPRRVARRVPSDYVLRLREKVGHDLLVVPSVAVLLFDDQRRVLLVRHDDRGLWVAPGSTVEPDEHPEAAALREMRQETGIEVELVGILGAFGGPEFRVRHPNGDQVGYVMTVYEARALGGVPPFDELDDLGIGFFSRERIDTIYTPRWLPVVLRGVAWG
ncbi:MAG TPA: NUDIX domain-containing protein [Longimicrobiales bacterium]|nr:NUDIX domain-containing protein [Longimicrobiales bacterium]